MRSGGFGWLINIMIKAKVGIKALSVNKVWQGRRFKTPEYKNYEKILMLALPRIRQQIPDKTRLKLTLCIGVSSKNQDLDNVCKPFLDILQKKYQFNDRYIYEISMTKEDVKKGSEYIEFCITPICATERSQHS